MKKFLTSLRRQEGFTLVELMVVVAIIGLLSAVAIPNFKKYQARSRTSEAKLQLAAVYTAEQAFYSDYNMYSNCLRYMGYDPSREAAQRYYLVGFPNLTAAVATSAYSAAVNSGLNSAAFAGTTTETINGITVATTRDGGCPRAGASTDGQTFFLPAKRLGTAIAVVGHANGTADAGLDIDESRDTALAAAGLGTQVDNDTMTFRAIAVGIVDSDKTATTDSSLFFVNQEKQIGNPRNGY